MDFFNETHHRIERETGQNSCTWLFPSSREGAFLGYYLRRRKRTLRLGRKEGVEISALFKRKKEASVVKEAGRSRLCFFLPCKQITKPS